MLTWDTPEPAGAVAPHCHPGEPQVFFVWLCFLYVRGFKFQHFLLPFLWGFFVNCSLQLQQTPGPENPVFLPSDDGCDWLLAKMWVRSADFHCHQLASHYLRTHMLGELCCVATLRQLPERHPLHQVHKLTPGSKHNVCPQGTWETWRRLSV